MVQQLQEALEYRGIKLEKSVALYKKDGNYNLKITNTLDKLFNALEENGHQLLSHYKRNKDQLLIDFNCGHQPAWVICGNYMQGCGCPDCGKKKRNSSNQLQKEIAKKKFIQLIEQNGHELLSDYNGMDTKVLIDFKCGHEAHWIAPNNYKGGSGCPLCAIKRKNYVEQMKKEREKELKALTTRNGHELLSEYKGNKTKVLINFHCGHEAHWITPDNYKHGHGCPECGKQKRNSAIELKKYVSEDEFEKLIKENEHVLLSGYENSWTNVLIDFKCGHEAHWINPSVYKKGVKCPRCAGNSAKQAYEDFLNMLEEKGHKLLEEYKGNNVKVLIDFQCGHEAHWITPYDYKKGKGCPRCAGNSPEQAYEDLKEYIEKNGHLLISEYKNANIKVQIDFKCGHEAHWIVPPAYKKGKGCPKCGVTKSKSKRISKAKVDFEHLVKTKEHELLTEYEGVTIKALIDFKCGHEAHWITPHDYKKGVKCPRCAGVSSEQGKENFHSLIESNGHVLLTEYKNSATKVLIDFKCGHEAHWIKPSDYKSGCGCRKCVRNSPKQAYEDLKELIEKNGHLLISEYKNANTKILIDFKCGHEAHWIVPPAYKKGRGCPKCGGIKSNLERSIKAKVDFEYLVKTKEHELLTEYEGATIKALIDFKCGHEAHWITPNDYKTGYGCPHCTESKGEIIIREWLDKQGIIYTTQYIFPNQTKRYDFMLPDDNLIVEVHGLQHYQETYFHENTKRTFADEQENDRLKKEYAESLGYGYLIIDYKEHNPKLALQRFIKLYDEFKKRSVDVALKLSLIKNPR